MFPISSDGVFEDPSIFFEEDKFLEDLLAECPIPEDLEKEKGSAKKRPRKASSSSGGGDGDDDEKKSAHRVTERQRRQDMAGLYASLRSLLPLEYIKGKRAISDHMQQAVKYINDTKKKIEEMQVKRDRLRKMCSVESNDADERNMNDGAGDLSSCVRMNNLTGDGLEILISSRCFSSLSKVLEDLLARQINVVHCVSSRGERSFLHKIQIEFNDSTSMDVSELQERVEDLIRYA